jgi:phage terminase small subunit
MDKLTQKQKKFIDYYIATGNGVEACKKAGYKGKNLNVIASQNLTKLNNEIQARLKVVEDKRILSIKDLQAMLSDVASNEENRMNDRLKAMELLYKGLGGFIEKVEVKKVKTNWVITDDED